MAGLSRPSRGSRGGRSARLPHRRVHRVVRGGARWTTSTPSGPSRRWT